MPSANLLIKSSKLSLSFIFVFSNPLARAFIKDFKDSMEIYGSNSNRFEYDFIAKEFPDVMSVGIDDITAGIIDIETTTEHGKIDTINVPEEILLITYQNLRTKKIQTFGWKLWWCMA